MKPPYRGSAAKLSILILVAIFCVNALRTTLRHQEEIFDLQRDLIEAEKNIERSNDREAFWRSEAERLAVQAGLALPLHQPDPIDP